MLKELEKIHKEALAAIEKSSDEKSLEDIRVNVTGRNGSLTLFLKKLGTLSKEERPVVGSAANKIKEEILLALEEKKKKLSLERIAKIESVDSVNVTLPGREIPKGSIHPINLLISDLVKIFSRAGFSVVFGPEIEIDYYNFEALNMPPAHPARDMQDTFYLDKGRLLRTHTSAVQVRIMEKKKPPLAIIAPGKVYRRDDDISHSPMFHQIEGLLVDEKTTFAHLKGVLTYVLHELFGQDLKVRFRPSYFPYTEPSAEVDIECVFCRGKGCKTCKQSGWLEVLGSGMVHPEVFKFVNYDEELYQGFAFGMGMERLAMLKYGINDIRLYYENDIRFLSSFLGILP